jgi:hypothetical protein
MATKSGSGHKRVHKHTSQGGRNPKTSAMNKTQKRTFKRYRGQGR